MSISKSQILSEIKKLLKEVSIAENEPESNIKGNMKEIANNIKTSDIKDYSIVLKKGDDKYGNKDIRGIFKVLVATGFTDNVTYQHLQYYINNPKFQEPVANQRICSTANGLMVVDGTGLTADSLVRVKCQNGVPSSIYLGRTNRATTTQDVEASLSFLLKKGIITPETAAKAWSMENKKDIDTRLINHECVDDNNCPGGKKCYDGYCFDPVKTSTETPTDAPKASSDAAVKTRRRPRPRPEVKNLQTLLNQVLAAKGLRTLKPQPGAKNGVDGIYGIDTRKKVLELIPEEELKPLTIAEIIAKLKQKLSEINAGKIATPDETTVPISGIGSGGQELSPEPGPERVGRGVIPASMQESKNWLDRTREKTSSNLFERLVKDTASKKVI